MITPYLTADKQALAFHSLLSAAVEADTPTYSPEDSAWPAALPALGTFLLLFKQ